MGLFKQLVTVGSADGSRTVDVEAWVDTGSTYTWLPSATLRALGFEPSEEREFILANGQRERRPVAQARLSLGGPSFYTYCAFAESGEELLLGAVALEEAGLAVDPVNKRLVPTAGYALTAIQKAMFHSTSRPGS
jgi:predicted aspartyl protease